MHPQDFIDLISPSAVASSIVTQIPASFTIAEAALESGWGAVAPGNNLFGVKADASWKGPIAETWTREYLRETDQWVKVPARWRAYDNWLGSIGDHAAFLRSNPRYSNAFRASTVSEFVERVAAAGYATDPQYAQKIMAVIQAHNLTRWDPNHVEPA
jgi:flagellum-specific peptidoglycan hydrolase FlgJ